VLMLRPNLAVADRSMNDFLRRNRCLGRKSTVLDSVGTIQPGVVNTSLRRNGAPGRHTQRRQRIDIRRLSAGRERTIRHVNLSGIKPVRHLHVFWKRADVRRRAGGPSRISSMRPPSMHDTFVRRMKLQSMQVDRMAEERAHHGGRAGSSRTRKSGQKALDRDG